LNIGKYFFKSSDSPNSSVVNYISTSIVFIVLLTTLCLFFYFAALLSLKYNNYIDASKKRKYYTIHNEINISGTYKCRICDKPSNLVRFGKFPKCNTTGFKHKFFTILYENNIWQLISESSYSEIEESNEYTSETR